MQPEAFEALFRHGPQPIAVLGRDDLRIRDVNDAALAVFGYRREDVIGRSTGMLGVWEDPATRGALLGELAREGRLEGVACRMRRRSGEIADAVLSAQPIEAGGERLLVVQFLDVSRRAEAERRTSQLTRFYAALSEIAEAVTRADDEVRLLQAVCEICVARVGNNVAYAILREPSARVVAFAGPAAAAYVGGLDPLVDLQVPGSPLAHVFDRGEWWISHDVPNDPVLAPWAGRFAEAGTRSLSVLPLFRGDRVVGLLSLHHPDPANYDAETADLLWRIGSAVWHAFDGLEAERDRRDTHAALAMLNHALDERVRARTRELEAVVSELDAFSYTVAHDLRAPLRAVNAYAQLAGEHCKSDPQGARDYLAKAAGSAAGLSRLIDDLLDFARAGRRPLEPSRVDMDQLAAQVIEELRPLYPRAAIDRQPLPAAVGDAFLLRQVLRNLLGNAFKFSSEAVAPKVEVFSRPGPDGAMYAVRDNGVGFDAARAGKLFGVFERMHDPGRFDGTGAGLAIVKRIVDRHGGSVDWLAAPGEGATFSFSLGNVGTAPPQPLESPPPPELPLGNPPC